MTACACGTAPLPYPDRLQTCGPTCEAARVERAGWDREMTLPWLCPFCAERLAKPSAAVPSYPAALRVHAPSCAGICSQVERYHDGEMERAEAGRFIAHLTTCSRCAVALEELLQLSGMVALTPAPRKYLSRSDFVGLVGDAIPLLALAVWHCADRCAGAAGEGEEAQARAEEARAREVFARAAAAVQPYCQRVCDACGLQEKPTDAGRRVGESSPCEVCGKGTARIVVRPPDSVSRPPEPAAVEREGLREGPPPDSASRGIHGVTCEDVLPWLNAGKQYGSRGVELVARLKDHLHDCPPCQMAEALRVSPEGHL